MSAWQKAHSSRDPVQKRCEYQGGAVLIKNYTAELTEKYGIANAEKLLAELLEKYGAEIPVKYRPMAPCLCEFEVAHKNAKRSKYCKVCAPFAKRWLSMLYANARYKANPEKFAKIVVKNRHKRREATGRPVRAVGSAQPCEYRENGERAEGCTITYTLTGAAGKYCPQCQLRIDAQRAAEWREKHPEEVKARGIERWKTITEKLYAHEQNVREIERVKNEIEVERKKAAVADEASARGIAKLEHEMEVLRKTAAEAEVLKANAAKVDRLLASRGGRPPKKIKLVDQTVPEINAHIPRARLMLQAVTEAPLPKGSQPFRQALSEKGFTDQEIAALLGSLWPHSNLGIARKELALAQRLVAAETNSTPGAIMAQWIRGRPA
jgi:hypothetical protein